MNMIRLSEVYISKAFRDTQPSERKLDTVRAYVQEHGELDKPLVLSGNMLTDNYVRYLVAKEVGLDEVPWISIHEYREQCVTPDEPVTFITGKFKNCDKEYVWKLTKNIPLEVGDRVLVKSKCKGGKNGSKAVTVTSIFTSSSSRMLRHKPVIKKLKAKSYEDKS